MNEIYTLSMNTATADMQSHHFPVCLCFTMGCVWVAAVAVLPNLLVNLTAKLKLYFPYKILNELLGMI